MTFRETTQDILEEFAVFAPMSRDRGGGGSSWEGFEYSLAIMKKELQKERHNRWRRANLSHMAEAENRRYRDNPAYRARKLAKAAEWKKRNTQKQVSYSRKHFLENQEALAANKRALRLKRALTVINDVSLGMTVDQVVAKHGVGRKSVLMWLAGKGVVKQ